MQQDEFTADGAPEAFEEMAKPDSQFVTTAQQPWLIVETKAKKPFNLLIREDLSTQYIYIPATIVRRERLLPESERPLPEVFNDYSTAYRYTTDLPRGNSQIVCPRVFGFWDYFFPAIGHLLRYSSEYVPVTVGLGFKGPLKFGGT